MKRQISLCLMMATFLGVTSCNDKKQDFDDTGNSSVISLSGPESAYMGDSIAFNFQIGSSDARLNQSKVQLLFDKTIVSERVMLTPNEGNYTGKIAIPFMKNIPDGTIKVKLRIQNERFSSVTSEIDIKISRPQYSKLVLRDNQGKAHDMLPVVGQPHTYAVTDIFPGELFATIEAPKYGENGNEMVFGNVDGKISNGSDEEINFSGDIDGEYKVTFNTLTYEGTPFIKFAINDIGFEKIDDYKYKVETEFKMGQTISITGLKGDYAQYWINPAFFSKVKGTNGTLLKFKGKDGKYRLTVDKTLKYFRVETMVGNALAELSKGHDVVWCIGDAGIGQPSFSKNGIGWTAGEKDICLTPIGNGRHQLVLETGKTLKKDVFTFKFFYQRGWGAEFTTDKISLIDKSPWFAISPTEPASGNFVKGSKSIVDGKFYIITVDISAGNNKAKMSVEEMSDFEEVD